MLAEEVLAVRADAGVGAAGAGAGVNAVTYILGIVSGVAKWHFGECTAEVRLRVQWHLLEEGFVAFRVPMQ